MLPPKAHENPPPHLTLYSITVIPIGDPTAFGSIEQWTCRNLYCHSAKPLIRSINSPNISSQYLKDTATRRRVTKWFLLSAVRPQISCSSPLVTDDRCYLLRIVTSFYSYQECALFKGFSYRFHCLQNRGGCGAHFLARPFLSIYTLLLLY